MATNDANMRAPVARSGPYWPRRPTVVRFLPLIALVLLALAGAPAASADGLEGPGQEAAGEPSQEPASEGSSSSSPESPPSGEQAGASTESEPPPSVEVKLPVAEVVQEVIESVTPVVEETVEAPVELPVTEPEPSAENPPARVTTESSTAPTGAVTGVRASTEAASQLEATNTSEQPAPVSAGAGEAVAPAPPITESSRQAGAASTARRARIGRTSEAICELSSVGSVVPTGCAQPTYADARLAGVPSFAAIVTSVTAAANASHASAGAASTRLAAEYHPSLPPPAPGQNGGGEGSAAAGTGSASAVAGTPEALVYLVVPHLMRRVRLLQRSWRTSFFVLIPERPG